MLDPNLMVDGYMKGMLIGAKLLITSIPWWLWLMVAVLTVLKAVTRIGSRKRGLGL